MSENDTFKRLGGGGQRMSENDTFERPRMVSQRYCSLMITSFVTQLASIINGCIYSQLTKSYVQFFLHTLCDPIYTIKYRLCAIIK